MAANGMEGNPTTEWLTYAEAGERLCVSPEAIRARAIRGHWRRQVGNDGLARVMVPVEILRTPVQQPINGRSTPVRKPGIQATLDALRKHIDTLKTDNERLTAELAGERAARQADQEQLAAARAAAADNERLHGDLAVERQRADRAIAELVDLARRLAAIAETQTSAETAEVEPEPPRHWAIRAWRWAQKTA
jgi:hypothetical protein